MAPCDWIALARTVLTPAQFTVWHSEYSQNAQMNNPVTLPVLLGSGDFATTADQARLDPHAFSQSTQIALRAMKAVPDCREFLPLTISIRVLQRHILTLLITSKKLLKGKEIMTEQPNLFCGS